MWFLLSCIAALLAVALARRVHQFRLFRRLGLPGPKPSLWTGNLVQITSAGMTKTFEQWSRRYGATYGYFYGLRPIINTTDAKLLHKVIFKDAHLFYNRAFIFNMDLHHSIAGRQVHVVRNPVETRAYRAQFTSAYTTAKLKEVACASERSVKMFLSVMAERCAAGREFDICEPLNRLAMDSLARTAFGVFLPIQTDDRLPQVVQDISHLGQQNLNNTQEFIATCLPSSLVQPALRLMYSLGMLANNNDPMVRSVGAIIDARKASPERKNDIIDNFFSRRIMGRAMTRNEMIGNATTAFSAGFETTWVTMVLTVYRLAQHPAWQHKVRQEVQDHWDDAEPYDSISKLNLLGMVINETLRLDPPAPGFVTREASEDYEHEGLLIPKGTSIQAPLAQLQRDPEVFPDPDAFNPLRFEGNPSFGVHFMPFGDGPRVCVGMRFAILQVKLAIARLLQNYHVRLGQQLKDMQSLPMVDSGILVRPTSLPVILEPVSSSF